jgi:hypothetical protein
MPTQAMVGVRCAWPRWMVPGLDGLVGTYNGSTGRTHAYQGPPAGVMAAWCGDLPSLHERLARLPMPARGSTAAEVIRGWNGDGAAVTRAGRRRCRNVPQELLPPLQRCK